MDWAAESHEISADGLTVYRSICTKGMTWADGTAIDATTFAYSINRSLDPALGSSIAYFLLIWRARKHSTVANADLARSRARRR